MSGLEWMALVIIATAILAYHRASLIVFTLTYTIFLAFAGYFSGVTPMFIVCSLILVCLLLPLNITFLRKKLISKHLLSFYQKIMPTMSRTEREAISAGTVTWEGDLFRGNPDWNKMLALPPAKLSQEEQDFLDGPVDEVCKMTNDWDITHNRADLPPEIWAFLKNNGFFAIIIPKQYGGKEFSAFAHSQIISKLSALSVTLSTTVAVPNSLGPAELLLHYGTEKQKNFYLPRLAKGEEIPCFALTSPSAGSDAGSMTDHGIVEEGDFDGEKILGIRLNFDKRYITLAPVATVIGLAFKLYDPNHLLGAKEDIGITCALIPRNTTGIEIGRRHFPLNSAFQNGPVKGKNVFIPLDWIIGGPKKAGKGWKMLMECLAVGRSISLPASAVGGAKVLAYTTGAYARIRKQFNLSIGKFEGIEAPLARIAAYTYIMDASRTFATATIDAGEKPSVASAIVKYHVTEMGRAIACDGMDIQGGKGICLGPKNFLGRGYEAAPIAITVEGANILTRNMIIFGQGAIRCHPYVLAELEAAKLPDPKDALSKFDRAVMKHVGFGFSNFFRCFILAMTNSFIVAAPAGELKRFYQHATRYCSILAFFTDVAMMSLGGSLKRKESISARLGDILSYLYLLSSVLKHHHDQGNPTEDLPLVRFSCLFCLYKMQEATKELLINFPNRALAFILKIVIFPFGAHHSKPRDVLYHKISQLMMNPTETRNRLAKGAFLTPCKQNAFAEANDTLLKVIAAEPIEKIIKQAKKNGTLTGYDFIEQAKDALKLKLIRLDEFDLLMQAEEAKRKIIAVDDFTTEELAHALYVQTSMSNVAS